MVTEKEFNNKFVVNYKAQTEFHQAIEELRTLKNMLIIDKHEKFVVIIKNTDEVGTIHSADVVVSDSYIEIGNFITLYDYNRNVAVEVYSVLGDEYCMIKHKIYNAYCFESLAGCTVSTYNFDAFARKLWDIGTTIHY